MKAVAFEDFFDGTLNRDVKKGQIFDVSEVHLDALSYLGLADECVYLKEDKKDEG